MKFDKNVKFGYGATKDKNADKCIVTDSHGKIVHEGSRKDCNRYKTNNCTEENPLYVTGENE